MDICITVTRKSYLPFYCIFQVKQFLKEILIRKSDCMMIRGEFRNLPNINDGADSHDLFCHKAASCLIGF